MKKEASYLNNLLGQNIVFMSREMGLELESNIFTESKITFFIPQKQLMKIIGELLTVNLKLILFYQIILGIGNGITRGYGTILGLFDPE